MARFYRKGKVRYFMSIIKHRKLRYQADILPLEPIGGTALVSAQNNTEIGTCNSLDADVEEDMTQVIYYVSDIHIEHQIEVIGKPLPEAREMILEKVNELVNTVDEDKGTILIAGDVADSIELTDIFYDELNQRMLQTANGSDWRIIAVLGNHELWNASQRRWFKPNVNSIIRGYKKNVPVQLLENELFVNYKGKNEYIIDEKTILKANPE